MRNAIIAILILFISTNACPQSNIQLPKNYIQISIPQIDSKEHLKLNYSEDKSIRLRNNKIEVFSTPKIKNSELKFNDGILIGSNHGEWGGELVYKTDEKEIKIKEGSIISIFKLNNKIYFLQGLAHLSINYGEIYELNYSKEKFSYRKVMDLTDEPQVFKIFNDRIYMATFSNFIIINNWKIESKINGFWESLYPNSLIIQNKNQLFMGIRGGIVEITINNKIVKLYTKK